MWPLKPIQVYNNRKACLTQVRSGPPLLVLAYSTFRFTLLCVSATYPETLLQL